MLSALVFRKNPIETGLSYGLSELLKEYQKIKAKMHL